MKMSAKGRVLFIPGGPWISGHYWDSFINEYMSEYDTNRMTLINHEMSYTPNRHPSIEDLVNLYCDKINDFQPDFIVAHSYGAWITVLALQKNQNISVKNIVLCNMPKTLQRSAEFNNRIAQTKVEVFDNDTFAEYFKVILPAYFPSNFSLDNLKEYSDEVYMEGNEKLLLTEQEVEFCIRSIPTLKSKVSLIFSNDDLITGKAYKVENCPVEVIHNSGHFPMLDAHESFSSILKKKLK